jgi:hypothetical protein
MKPLYRRIASLVVARLNCLASGNVEWKLRHEEAILALVREHMPSGSGIDNGTAIDLDKSTGERLEFLLGYHHMTEGYYDGWSEFRLVVTPSFEGVNLRFIGRDRDEIKEYLHEAYHHALTADVADAKASAA